MNILILSAGTRNKIVQYFKKTLEGKGLVIATDCSDIAPALYDADKYYIVPRMIAPEYIDVVLGICKKEGVTGVLSLIDPELSLLAKHTGYTLLKPNGAQQKSSEKRSGNCYVYALMRTMFMGSGSNLFLRKSVVDEIQGYDETFVRNQDIEFMVRALEKYKLAYIDENLLIIHQEKDRKKRSFEEIDGYAKYFLFKFEKRINNLSYVDKKNVLTVISLERMRIAFSLKHYKDGIAILRDNKVSLLNCLKYFDYLVYRKITKKSFGFSL